MSTWTLRKGSLRRLFPRGRFSRTNARPREDPQPDTDAMAQSRDARDLEGQFFSRSGEGGGGGGQACYACGEEGHRARDCPQGGGGGGGRGFRGGGGGGGRGEQCYEVISMPASGYHTHYSFPFGAVMIPISPQGQLLFLSPSFSLPPLHGTQYKAQAFRRGPNANKRNPHPEISDVSLTRNKTRPVRWHRPSCPRVPLCPWVPWGRRRLQGRSSPQGRWRCRWRVLRLRTGSRIPPKFTSQNAHPCISL